MSEEKKMSPYAIFGTDKKVERQGITIDFGDFVFHIARAGGSNTKYAKAMTRIMRKQAKAIKAGTVPANVMQKMLAEVYAESVILGWTGMTDIEGNELVFTKENCVKLLLDLPELFNQLVADAENFNNFKAVEAEEIAKNS